jgi:hypothetical protein
MIKVTGSLQKSTEIMKLSSALVKLPQISQSMREMSMEMMKVSHQAHGITTFHLGSTGGYRRGDDGGLTEH